MIHVFLWMKWAAFEPSKISRTSIPANTFKSWNERSIAGQQNFQFEAFHRILEELSIANAQDLIQPPAALGHQPKTLPLVVFRLPPFPCATSDDAAQSSLGSGSPTAATLRERSIEPVATNRGTPRRARDDDDHDDDGPRVMSTPEKGKEGAASPSHQKLRDRVSFFERVWTGGGAGGSVAEEEVDVEEIERRLAEKRAPPDTLETVTRTTEEGDLASGVKTVKVRFRVWVLRPTTAKPL